MTMPEANYRPFKSGMELHKTSYPLQSLPYLAYDNVNPAMVISMMLHSFMPAFEKFYCYLLEFESIIHFDRIFNKLLS